MNQKTVIRIMLVLASSFMVVGNWHNGFFPLGASVLFLSANVWAFVYNRVKKGV